jgi:signal transduction histidine kinase
VGSVATLARRYGFDALIVLAALQSAVQVSVSAKSHETASWFAAPAVALVVLTLLARRRFPFWSPASLWLAGAALSFVDGELISSAAGAFAAGMAAAFLLGNLQDSLAERVGLILVIGGAAIVTYNNPEHSAGELLFTPILFAILWLAGYALRERAEQAEAAETRATRAEQERETATRLAVAEERTRIARELHDIVAHAVSVMVLQVGAVRHNLPDTLDDDRDALKDVEKIGRTALAEMRRLLDAMRREEDDIELEPQPGLHRLDSLLEEVRHAGLPVELHVEGEPVELPGAIDLSAYRIVQEGLTNALKHARASRVDLALRYSPEELQIEVADDGPGGGSSDALGHGLVGIRERVTLYGGEMTAGASNGGGFVLRTRLPLGGYRA